MSYRGVSMRSGCAHKRAKLWFAVPDEDWEIMLPTMHRSYVNRYRIEFMKYKQDLRRLGYGNYSIGYIVAMRSCGYTFDALESHFNYWHFWYDGGSTHFRSWKAVKAWLNEYGR